MPAERAAFSDIRTVRSRGVMQLVLEISIESADQVLKSLGGVPVPGQERWVAIAPLVKEVVKQTEAERKSWSELRPSAQAALKCNDPLFQRFMCAANADEAAEFVRAKCGVSSRSLLDTNAAAAAKWQQLYSTFTAERDYGGMK